MSKEARTIWARGLTSSDRGSIVEFHDLMEKPHKVRIEDVGYDGTSTVIKFVEIARVPNNLPIQIWDSE